MKDLKPNLLGIGGGVALMLASAVLAAPGVKPPADPAKIAISVSPGKIAPGGTAEITLRLTPASGIKINRYPKIKLSIPQQAGVASAAEASVGNDSPPPVGDTESNYFAPVDPLILPLRLDEGTPSGPREIAGELTYYYCVSKSWFCAPKKTPVKIALEVE